MSFPEGKEIYSLKTTKKIARNSVQGCNPMTCEAKAVGL